MRCPMRLQLRPLGSAFGSWAYVLLLAAAANAAEEPKSEFIFEESSTKSERYVLQEQPDSYKHSMMPPIASPSSEIRRPRSWVRSLSHDAVLFTTDGGARRVPSP